MFFNVGIDVSKYKHTIAIIDEEGEVRKKSFNISNTREGFNSLLNELGLLGQKEQIKIGMEATGHYMTCLSKFLVANGYKVQIYNPFIVERFRESETNKGSKTDKKDAYLIARFVMTHQFSASPQISYYIEQLRKMSRAKYFFYADKIRAYNHLQRYLDEIFPELLPFLDRKRDGTKGSHGRNILDSKTTRWLLSNYPSATKIANMRKETAEKLKRMSRGKISYIRFEELKDLAKNSIGTPTAEDEQIVRSLIIQIEAIDKEIEEFETKIDQIMNQIQSPITSIPGIGNQLGAMILGEIGDIKRFDNPEKLIRYAGLDVRIYQSGTINQRGKIVKRGSPILRYALALTIQKLRIHSPVFSEYYYSKIREGKHTQVAIIATTRKLIRVIWKMLYDNVVFENLAKN